MSLLEQSPGSRGQELAVHGWVHSIADGILHDLNVTVLGLAQAPEHYHYGSLAA